MILTADVIDSDRFVTASGRTYRVDYVADPDVTSPHENGDYMLTSLAFDAGRDGSYEIEPSEYVQRSATRVIDAETVVGYMAGFTQYDTAVSNRTIARWLKLCGAQGVCYLTVDGHDGSVTATPYVDGEASPTGTRGLAWIDAGVVDAVGLDRNASEIAAEVVSEVEIYSAWRTGDTFGVTVTETDADGEDIRTVPDTTVWGYVGLSLSRPATLAEARAQVEAWEAATIAESARKAAATREATHRARLSAVSAVAHLEAHKRTFDGAHAVHNGHVLAERAAARVLRSAALASIS